MKKSENAWGPVLNAKLAEELSKRGYFAIADSNTVGTRFAEFHDAGQPRPKAEREMARRVGADGILYIQYFGEPEIKCEYTQAKVLKVNECVNSACGTSEYSVVDFKKTMAVGIMTVPFSATLVDTRTGVSSTIRGTAGNLAAEYASDCPSNEEITKKFVRENAWRIAKTFSPKTGELEVQFETDTNGCPKPRQKEASELLNKGIQFALKKNYREARDQWLQAAEMCEQKSPAASWNLAIYYWLAGDDNLAKEHFDRAMRLGGSRYSENEYHQQALTNFRFSIYHTTRGTEGK